ncbi:hypothetical protein HK100_001211, partial [Physocladia obscura]
MIGLVSAVSSFLGKQTVYSTQRQLHDCVDNVVVVGSERLEGLCARRLIPIVKCYKSQKNKNVKTLPTVEFNGTVVDLKTTLWATVAPELKGKATVNSSGAVQNESGGVKIENFADFIVVLKNQRSYSFGVVARPFWTIKDNMMGTLAAGDGELTVFIYAYSRSVGKSADYEKVIRSINGGLEGIDKSGVPNEFNTIIEQLKTYHPHLQGENMIWCDWAGIFRHNPSTLQQAMQLPPPVKITNLFDRQLGSEAQ